MAVCVLIHHLYQHSGLFYETIIGGCLQATGYLSVACFFFLSGYGLYVSYNNKRIDYIKRFWKNKILPFYFIILLFTLIYLGRDILIGKNIEFSFKWLFLGDTVIGNGWYLQVQLMLYILFYLTFLFIKNGKKCIFVSVCECVLYCVLMYKLGYSSFWYEGVFAFTMGMIWRELELRFSSYMNSKRVFGVCILEFLIVCIATVGYKMASNDVLMLVSKMVSVVFFAMLVASAVNLVNIENKLTRWLGKYSMEIYIVQGIFLTTFHSELIYISNTYLYIILVMSLTILTAILVKPVTNKVISLIRKV